MIDIERDVFAAVSALLTNTYSGIYVTDDYVNKPATFPAVILAEMDNTVSRNRQDTDHIERAADVTFQVDIYSTKAKGRKAEARAIAQTIDLWFSGRGFSRSYFSPMPNQYGAQIYRITCRYRATVGDNKVIYRR